MSKPNDVSPRLLNRAGPRLAAVIAAASVALVASAGTLLQSTAAARTGSDDRPPGQVRPTLPAGAPASYQLRCWQYGRLLFDEGPVTLPADARQSATLVAIDRHGSPLIVTDTGGATCLARPSAASAPNLALPR